MNTKGMWQGYSSAHETDQPGRLRQGYQAQSSQVSAIHVLWLRFVYRKGIEAFSSDLGMTSLLYLELPNQCGIWQSGEVCIDRYRFEVECE